MLEYLCDALLSTHRAAVEASKRAEKLVTMSRRRIQSRDDATRELPNERTRPPWPQRAHALPFDLLSDDEFEIFCYLLLLREFPADEIYYYGKTADGGRDIMHRNATNKFTLIQCKRYAENVGVREIRRELAKLCVNIEGGAIPDKIDRVVFYISRDITAPAKDLLSSQDTWIGSVREFLNEHLSEDPTPELLNFARAWWPEPTSESGIKLTERAQRYPELIEEFFGVRKVIDTQALEPIKAISSRVESKIDIILSAQQKASEDPPANAINAGNQAELLRKPAAPAVDTLLGREGTLAALHGHIRTSNTIILGGVPGIGKTSIAAQFAKEISVTRKLLWVDCDPHGQLATVLSLVADFLRTECQDAELQHVLQSNSATQAMHVECAAASLDKHSVILVLDGFEVDANVSLVALVTRCNRLFNVARLLIAARKWSDRVALFNLPQIINIDMLDRAAAVALMLRCAERLSVPTPQREDLVEAYGRIGGHPYMLRLLVALSRSFPLPQLLQSLPRFEQQAHDYVRRNIIDQLVPSAQKLLANLSLIRIPFYTLAVEQFDGSRQCWDNFESLVDRFLIMRCAYDSSRYEIHRIIRDSVVFGTSDQERHSAHCRAYVYHHNLSDGKKTLADGRESVYHALLGNMPTEAESACKMVLYALMRVGWMDAVLEWTDSFGRDACARAWPMLHYQRGRTLRLKGRPDEARVEYEEALRLTSNPAEVEGAKFELASMIVSCHGNDPQKRQRAINIYNELALSDNCATRASALGTAGWLEAEYADKQRGIEMIRASLELAERHALKRQVAQSLYWLGVLLCDANVLDAIEYAERSVELWGELEARDGAQAWEGLYSSACLLSNLYRREHRCADALQVISICVALDRRLGRDSRLSERLLDLGCLECLLALYGRAAESLRESLALARGCGVDGDMEVRVLELLVIALWNSGDYVKSRDVMIEYRELCEVRGCEGAPYVFVSKDDYVRMDEEPETCMSRRAQMHILVLPNGYSVADLQSWLVGAGDARAPSEVRL